MSDPVKSAILEQAVALSPPPEPEVSNSVTPDPADDLQIMVAALRTTLQQIAAAARERFPEELATKIGRKVTRNMVRGLDALYAIEELLERRPKRSRKALTKAKKSVEGLPEGGLVAILKGLKKARKTLERVIDSK